MAEKPEKQNKGFDPTSRFTKAVVAASYLGLPYSTLMQGESGTLCLGEFRRKQGGRVVFFTMQLIAHAAKVAAHDECDGFCKAIAEKEIKKAREEIKALKAVA
jgi:hypothetical protein